MAFSMYVIGANSNLLHVCHIMFSCSVKIGHMFSIRAFPCTFLSIRRCTFSSYFDLPFTRKGKKGHVHWLQRDKNFSEAPFSFTRVDSGNVFS